MRTKIKIILEAAHEESMKIAAIKTIRIATDCGLAEAKEILGNCLMGKKPEIKVDSADAQGTAKKLSKLGIIVRYGNEVFDNYQNEPLAKTYRDYQVGLVLVNEALKINDSQFKIICKLLNGNVRIGNSLAIPINPLFIFSFKIVDINKTNEFIELIFDEDSEEDIEFLSDFEIIGDELPILNEELNLDNCG